MRAPVLLMVSMALGSCAEQIAVPDLCKMPSGFRSWNGAEVLWTGIIVGEYHHGFVLACEEHRGGIRFSTDENTVGRDALHAALDRLHAPSAPSGVLRMTVEGRLGKTWGEMAEYELATDRPILRITAVRRIWFERMSEEATRSVLSR